MIRKENKSRLISDDIERLLLELQAEAQKPVYVNRPDEEDKITDLIASKERILILTGLSGMGRKTLFRRTLEDQLSYSNVPVIEVKNGDTVQSLSVKIEAYLNLIPLEKAKEKAYSKKMDSDEVASDYICEIIKDCTDNRKTFLCLEDIDGLLDQEKNLHSSFLTLFTKVIDKDLRLGIISRNRIKPNPLTGECFPDVFVSELNERKRLQLIKILFIKYKEATEDDLKLLAKATTGYPPAAYLAYTLAEREGISALCQQLSRLSDSIKWKLESEIAYFQPHLNEEMKSCLQTLSQYNPLPIEVLKLVCMPSGKVEALSKLIDFSLVEIRDGLYFLLEPLRNSCFKLFEGSKANHKKVADLLNYYLEERKEEKYFHLAVLLDKASILSGVQLQNGLRFQSTPAEIIKEAYHNREYDRVAELAPKILEEIPHNVQIISFLAQSYARLNRRKDSQNQIDQLKKMGANKQASFAKGFLEKREGNYKEAKATYEQALQFGYWPGSGSIYRELSECYYELEDYKTAEEYIGKALRRDSGNTFSYSLAFKISHTQDKRVEAQEYLEKMKTSNSPEWYHHYNSIFKLKYVHSKEEAIQEAKKACELSKPRTPFEIHGNLVSTLIKSNQLDEAGKELGNMRSVYGRGREVELTLLHCEFLIKYGDLYSANQEFSKIPENKSRRYLAIKRQIEKNR